MKAKKQSQSPDPWAAMERLFNGGFPFSGLSLPADLMMKPEWFEHVVQEALTQPLPSQSKELYTHNIFETHKSVIVRIQLPNSLNPELLRVYVRAASLRVEGFPNQTEKKVQLPCEVNTVGIRSSFKDGILEIRMVKKRSSDQERQINISIL
ncbi:MAG: Hsp20/alpha crystallin family protein [Paenibacillaceae bacterium]